MAFLWHPYLIPFQRHSLVLISTTHLEESFPILCKKLLKSFLILPNAHFATKKIIPHLTVRPIKKIFSEFWVMGPEKGRQIVTNCSACLGGGRRTGRQAQMKIATRPSVRSFLALSTMSPPRRENPSYLEAQIKSEGFFSLPSRYDRCSLARTHL